MKTKTNQQNKTFEELLQENQQLEAENLQLKKQLSQYTEHAPSFQDPHPAEIETSQYPEDWYKIPFNETKAILFIVDPEQKQIVDANPAACDFYGYSYSELVGMKISEINTAAPERLHSALNQAVQGERPLFLFNHRLADGTIRQVEVDSSPITINNHTYLFSIIHDVTNRLKMENALRESEAKFKLLVESAVDGIVLMDTKGCIQLVNPRLRELMHCPGDPAAMQKYFCEIFQADQSSIIQNFLQHVIDNGKASLQDITVQRRDETTFEADIQAALLSGVEGEPDQIVAYLRDVSQENANQRIIQKNEEHLRMISELTTDEVFVMSRASDGNLKIEWNTGTLNQMGGFAPEDARLESWQFLTPESKEKLRLILQSQFDHPTTQTTDAAILTRAGEERMIRVFSQSVVSPINNRPIKVVGAIKDITDQIRAEKSLAASENLFRSIFENGPTGMVTVSLSGKILQANSAYSEMLGYDRDELLNQSIYDLTVPDYREQTRKMYQELLDQKSVYGVQDKQYIRKDGSVFWGEIRVSLVKTEDNQPDYFIALVSDVTKQKEALEKLRQNEELIANTIANVSVVLFVIDTDGKFLLSEGRGLALLGLKPGEVVGKNYADIYAGHSVILEGVEKASCGEYVQTRVVLGETIFDTYFSPFTDRNGNVMGTVGIAVDITEKERAIEQLRESEEKYTSIFSACPVPLSVSNFQSGELLDVNQQFLDEYGFTRDEVIGHSAAELGIFSGPEVRKKIIDTVKQEGQVNHIELQTKRKNGDKCIVLYSAKRVTERGRDYLLSVSSNITSQKRNEEELFTSREMLQSILDHIPQRVFWKDTQHRYQGANRQYLMDAGLSSFEQIAGKSDAELFESRYHDSFEATDNIVIKNDTPYLNYEEQQPVIGGQVLWVRTNKIPLHDQQGKVNMILGTYEDMTDIREAQIKLTASEERFRNLAMHAPVGIYEKDQNHIPLFANQRLLDMIGFSPIETDKEDWMQGIHPGDLPVVRRDWEATILEGKDFYGEYRRLKPDGMVFWVADHEKVIRDSQGNITGYLGTLSDITQIKQAEMEIKRSLSLQTATLESTTDGIIVVNLDGEITSYNQKFTDLWNLPPQKLEKANYATLTEKMRSLLIANDAHRQKISLIRKDQAEKTFSTLFLADGRVFEEFSLPQILDDEIVGRVWSYRDVTARFRADEKLRQNNLEMQQMIKRLTALRNIDTAITGHSSFIEVVKDIIPNVATSANADAVTVLLPHTDGEHLYIVGQQGLVGENGSSRDITDKLINLSGRFAGQAFRTRQTVWLEDLRSDPDGGIQGYEETFAGYAAVPLIAKSEVKGVLEIFTKSPAPKDPSNREFIHSLAMQVAIAIDNADLFSRMENTNLDLLAAYEATIEGWARALELRDNETLGHSERVIQKTIHLATRIGISDDDLIQLRRGVFLHDIGKMAVPDNILLKPGPLTDDEWVIMKMHPSYAYEMLVGIPYLRHALEIPYCHHEKWDGSGYPRGLKEEEIPLAARVFSVIDVWDALTSKRPYRPAWPEQQVKTYLREQSGKQFDPRIVDEFLRMLEEGEN